MGGHMSVSDLQSHESTFVRNVTELTSRANLCKFHRRQAMALAELLTHMQPPVLAQIHHWKEEAGKAEHAVKTEAERSYQKKQKLQRATSKAQAYAAAAAELEAPLPAAVAAAAAPAAVERDSDKAIRTALEKQASLLSTALQLLNRLSFENFIGPDQPHVSDTVLLTVTVPTNFNKLHSDLRQVWTTLGVAKEAVMICDTPATIAKRKEESALDLAEVRHLLDVAARAEVI